jgi:hypothetical protein
MFIYRYHCKQPVDSDVPGNKVVLHGPHGRSTSTPWRLPWHVGTYSDSVSPVDGVVRVCPASHPAEVLHGRHW